MDDIKDEKWKFAVQLCGVNGLRPEELRNLGIKDGVEEKELWSIYQKSKGGRKGSKTEPRRLHPLLIEQDGEPIDWKLHEQLAIGESLKPFCSEEKVSESLRTHI